MTDDEKELVYSPLQQSCTMNGHTVEIHIYKFEGDNDWSLELVDAAGTSTVWDDRFDSDKAALDHALECIEKEGIEAFLTETLPSKVH